MISARPLGLRDGSTIICRFESEFDTAEVVLRVPYLGWVCSYPRVTGPLRMVYDIHMSLPWRCVVLCRLKVP